MGAGGSEWAFGTADRSVGTFDPSSSVGASAYAVVHEVGRYADAAICFVFAVRLSSDILSAGVALGISVEQECISKSALVVAE